MYRRNTEKLNNLLTNTEEIPMLTKQQINEINQLAEAIGLGYRTKDDVLFIASKSKWYKSEEEAIESKLYKAIVIFINILQCLNIKYLVCKLNGVEYKYNVQNLKALRMFKDFFVVGLSNSTIKRFDSIDFE